MKIVEIDVWQEGTDEELAALAASKGAPLAGHPDLVCSSACIEQSPDTSGPGEPQFRLGEDGKPALDPQGKPIPIIDTRPHSGGKQLIIYPTIPGKKRARCNYTPKDA